MQFSCPNYIVGKFAQRHSRVLRKTHVAYPFTCSWEFNDAILIFRVRSVDFSIMCSILNLFQYVDLVSIIVSVFFRDSALFLLQKLNFVLFFQMFNLHLNFTFSNHTRVCV